MSSHIPVYAIVRVRGRVNTPHEVEYTLRLLRLYKKYHCVVYPANLPGLQGMLNKVKDWVTWGEIDMETLTSLLRARGRIPGGKPLTDEYVDVKLGDKGVKGGIQGLAEAILTGRIILHKVDNLIKPVFRLHPPRGGFKGTIKKPYSQGGDTGYRGAAINELIKRML
ncbi:MAG: 50S ribosomal protein L30 [Thermosphaera sp.]|nr:50S ribosomal protein L30 [Thermosphaera sp.]